MASTGFQIPFPDLSVMLGGGGPAPVASAAKQPVAPTVAPTGPLRVTLVKDTDSDQGYLAQCVVLDDHYLVFVGGTYGQPTVLVSTNGKRWVRRKVESSGLRAAVAHDGGLLLVGEYGLLARSEDVGASWTKIPTETQDCVFGITLHAGVPWVCGDDGWLGKLESGAVHKVDLGIEARISDLVSADDRLFMLGYDGTLRVFSPASGSTAVTDISVDADGPLCAMCRTKTGAFVLVGDGGFVARSDDGRSFTKVELEDLDVTEDLEAVDQLASGTIVIVGDNATILMSTDDGWSWTKHATEDDAVPDEWAHLWSVLPFGHGALIGSDDGAIWRLAPDGDTTWAERADELAGEGDAEGSDDDSDDDSDGDDSDDSDDDDSNDFRKIIAQAIPASGRARMHHLMHLNDACVRAHAAKDYAAAVAIADHAQSVAAENPFIYHAAACAYAAAGDLEKAFEQVRLAVAARYTHLDRVETDSDLGEILTWPRFKELFAAYHASPVKEYDRPLDELELSVRTANGLQNAKLRYVGDVVRLAEADLLRVGNLGAKSLKELKELLAEMGLQLATDVGTWSPPRKVEDLVASDDDDDDDYDEDEDEDEDVDDDVDDDDDE